ncbi:unnamed protein product [Rotaria sp. Silwood2]|nr:unnamed protein product [Rotaria sp. Silwood2]
MNEPDLIGDVLGRANAPNYEKPADVVVALEKLFGRRNLFLMERSEHDRARRMINPAFHYVNLQSMVSIITDCTAEAIESMLCNDMKSKLVDLQVLFNALTMSIIVSSAFGTDFKRNPHARDIVCRTFAQILEINENRWMMMINQIPWLARLLFWAVGDEGESFTDEEIKEESLPFIFAGSKASDVCEEVDQVLPNRITPTNEHLSELVVCAAVINETLRLYPPAPLLVRHYVCEHTIGKEHQIRIPQGAIVAMNAHTGGVKQIIKSFGISMKLKLTANFHY